MKKLLSAFVAICLGALLFSVPVGSAAAADGKEAAKVVTIGSRLELFVDGLLIDRTEGTELRLHQSRPMPRSLSTFDGDYMTVIRDEDKEGVLFRAWYRDRNPDHSIGGLGPQHRTLGTGGPAELTRYAESRDGHEWTFPELGLFEVKAGAGAAFVPRHGKNNIVFREPPFVHNFSPFLDARPGVPPAERFKAIAGVERSTNQFIQSARELGATDEEIKRMGYQAGLAAGLYTFSSPDGKRWTRSADTPVITACDGKAFDSQNVAFWSEAEQMYVCYFRTWVDPHTGKGGQAEGLRTISRSTSRDFINWSSPVPMKPNEPGEHLYTSQTHPYFRAPHIYIATPTRFQPDRGDSTDILFMSSRAGSTFYDRLFKEAFISPGLDKKRWGNRSNYLALNIVPTSPTEMSLYHKDGTRYTLRTDGFVSVRAGYEPGEMLTRPLVFSGDRLILNVSTSAAGSLRVELQNAAGKAMPGFGLDDCRPLVGDAIEMQVRWKDDPDLAALAGKPVRLRFVMQEADLYSLRFVE